MNGYAPELFGQIKVMCDEGDATGQFLLIGSQQFEMMKNVRESLAGRIGILELYSLSMDEILGVEHDDELDFSLSNLLARQGNAPKNDVVLF